MGATKDKRKARKQAQRMPWEPVSIRMKSGQLLRINCPRCSCRTVVRYWDPAQHRAVCFDCVPDSARHLIPKQRPSDPDRRPMALA